MKRLSAFIESERMGSELINTPKIRLLEVECVKDGHESRERSPGPTGKMPLDNSIYALKNNSIFNLRAGKPSRPIQFETIICI